MTKSKGISKRDVKYTDGRSAWQEDEDRFLKENCEIATVAQIAKYLGRSHASVNGRIKRLGIKAGGRGANKNAFRVPRGAIMIARTCSRCGLFLPENWFHVVSTGHRDQICKSCRNEINKSLPYKDKYKVLNNDKERAKNKVTAEMATRIGVKWEEEEDDFLRQNYKDKGDFQLAIEIGRTMKSVTHRRQILGLNKNRIRYNDPISSMWVIHFPNAIKALREEFKRLGVPESEWDWTD